jgi:prohibitin 2
MQSTPNRFIQLFQKHPWYFVVLVILWLFVLSLLWILWTLIIIIALVRLFKDPKKVDRIYDYINNISRSKFWKDLWLGNKDNSFAGNVVNTETINNSFTSSSHTMETNITGTQLFKRFIGLLVIIFVIGIIFGSFFIIQPGTRWILVRLGSVLDATYQEWLHFKIPYIDHITVMSIQTQKIQWDGNAASKDLQSVQWDVALNYRLDPTKLISIFQNIGDKDAIEIKIIWPMIQEWVKATTAKYTAEELITKRQLVSSDMTDAMKKKLETYGIIVQDVNIVNFRFSEDFDKSIENKVQAEQEALTEKNKLESIKFQAQQTIESAKAQAESIRIQSEAIQNQWGTEYVNLKWIEKRDGKLPTTQLGGNTPIIYNPATK